MECIEAVETYTTQGQNDFLTNALVQDAVLRRLQIMAESTQRLGDELKAQAPNVVWQIVENNLPSLKVQIESILAIY
ncbi:HepT-like ribonuclease domain-containing protein [Roseofilum halophilum]|uniref:HepT-like ribonuclease domain-containing protein n=1 Tax=Roseofilum halophilum TaxID=3082942 RepID=UPI0032199473